MLQGVLTQHQGGKSYFVDRKGRFNTDPVNPTFMNALKQDAEITGGIEAGALAKTLQYSAMRNKELQEMWDTGYGTGVKSAEIPFRNRGFMEGAHSMLGEFTGHPLQVFDLEEPLIRPLVKAKNLDDLTINVPQGEANPRFRPFQSEVIYESKGKRTPQELKEYLKVGDAPYYHHPGNSVLALNLPKFMQQKDAKGNPVTHVDGRIGKTNSAGTERSKEAKFLESREDILRNAIVGKRLTDVPPAGDRPETEFERSQREEARRKKAEERAARKAAKPMKILAEEEEPRVMEVKTPQKMPKKPRVSVPEAVELRLSPKKPESDDDMTVDELFEMFPPDEPIDPNPPAATPPNSPEKKFYGRKSPAKKGKHKRK